MNREFNSLKNFINRYDGTAKPKINLQDLYKLYPEFIFEASKNFGDYENFGKAFCCKVYDMKVISEKGNECYMVYREYQDANENLAYIS